MYSDKFYVWFIIIIIIWINKYAIVFWINYIFIDCLIILKTNKILNKNKTKMNN